MSEENNSKLDLWTGVVIIISLAALIYIFSIKAKAEEESIPLVDCVRYSEFVRSDLADLWRRVEGYPNSLARDGIFTSSDYSKAYYEVMKRTSRRIDRTKGIYQELWDRWRYTYRYATTYPWNNTGIYNTIELVERDINYLGSYCYR